jgi:hypothetical protein
MNFENISNDIYNNVGTSLMGYTGKLTRAEIESVFGKPWESDGDSGDGKVTVEWILRFEDGTIATIYDWKRYEMGTPRANELYDWHIGGENQNAISRVMEALGRDVSSAPKWAWELA